MLWTFFLFWGRVEVSFLNSHYHKNKTCSTYVENSSSQWNTISLSGQHFSMKKTWLSTRSIRPLKADLLKSDVEQQHWPFGSMFGLAWPTANWNHESQSVGCKQKIPYWLLHLLGVNSWWFSQTSSHSSYELQELLWELFLLSLITHCPVWHPTSPVGVNPVVKSCFLSALSELFQMLQLVMFLLS